MNKILLFLKEYLTILTIVPLILGGLWQLLSLAAISTSYVRFFSVTQQIADGILIIFVLAVLFLTFYSIKKFFYDDTEFKLEEWVQASWSSLIWRAIYCAFVLFMFFIFSRIKSINPLLKNAEISLSNLVFVLFFGSVILFITVIDLLQS